MRAQAEQLDAVQKQLPLVRMARQVASSSVSHNEHSRSLLGESNTILQGYKAGREAEAAARKAEAAQAAANEQQAAKQEKEQKEQKKRAADQEQREAKAQKKADAAAARVDNDDWNGLPKLIDHLRKQATKPENAQKFASFDAEAELQGWDALKYSDGFKYKKPGGEMFDSMRRVAEHFGLQTKRKASDAGLPSPGEEAGTSKH